MIDQSENQPVLSEDFVELESPGLRGISGAPVHASHKRGLKEFKEPQESSESEESDQLEMIFKSYDQICSKIELIIISLYEIFPLINQLSQKISQGNQDQDYRLDRRLRLSLLNKTVATAYSHLNKVVRFARLISVVQRSELNESPFE